MGLKQCKLREIKSFISDNFEDYEFFDNPSNSNFEEFLNDMMNQLGIRTISDSDKVKILNQTKEFLKTNKEKLKNSGDTSDKTERQIQKIDETQKVIDNILKSINSISLSGVSTPDKVHGGNLDFFEVSIEKDKAFVPGISAVLSATVKQDIAVLFKTKLLFTQGGERCIIDSSELSEEIHQIKRDKINYLRKWLIDEGYASSEELPTVYQIFSNEFSIEERYSKYHTLMSKVASFLKDYINAQGGVVNQRTSETLRKKFLDPLECFLILQNFDNFVEHFIGEDVNILPKLKGDFLNSDDSKYVMKSESHFEHSFQDGLTQDDGSHTTPHLVKLAFNSIRTGGDNTEFLSNQDHRQIVQFFNHMWADENITEATYNALKKLFTARNTDEEYEALMEVLKSKEFTARYKESKQKALIDFLEKYYKAYKQTAAGLNIEELENFNRHKNVIHALVHSIQSQRAAVFVATTENGNEIRSSVDKYTSKKQIFDAIKIEAKHNYLTGLDQYVYSAGFSVNDKSVEQIGEIYSPAVQRVIRQILGQGIAQNVIDEADPEFIQLVGRTLSKVQYYYRMYLSSANLSEEDLEARLNKFIEALKKDSDIVKFTNKLVEKESAQIQKIYSQELNPLPGENICSVLSDFEKNSKEFLDSFATISSESGQTVTSKNVILQQDLHKVRPRVPGKNDEDGFVSHNSFRSDVKIVCGDRKKVVSHTQLEPSELVTVALNYDWIQSLMDHNVFFLQTETYSDKPRVLMHQYNFAGRVEGNTVGTPFYAKSSQELLSLHFEQQQAYYKAIELDIVNHWNKLLPYLPNVSKFNSIEDILSYITSNNLSWSVFKNAIQKYQSANPNDKTNFIEHYDYINDKGKITLNGSLLYKIKTSRSKSLFIKEHAVGFNKFKDGLKKNLAPILLNPDCDTKKLKQILGLTGKDINGNPLKDEYGKDITDPAKIEEITDNQLAVLLQEGQVWCSDDSIVRQSKASADLGGLTEAQVIEQVLYKYYTTQALLSDADLQIGIKQPWLHIPKGVKYFNASDLLGMMNDANYQVTVTDKKGNLSKVNVMTNIRASEYSKRLVAGKKRNSAGVATFTPQKQGERFGVPATMKVIMAAFPKQIVENHVGIKDDGGQKPHDGSSWVFGIYSQFEENSYPDHDYLGTRKTIGLIPHFGSFTQVKHAENTLTNELLRGMAHRYGSADHKAAYEFDPDRLIEVGYKPCKLSANFIKNFSKKANRKQFESDGIFYNFNGHIAKLTDIDCTEDGRFKLTWIYEENGEQVSSKFVEDMIGLTADENGYIKLETLLDLYKAFGGYNSMSFNENEHIVPSEISNVVCARLISYYDVDPSVFDGGNPSPVKEQSMKETMVAKIIDPESCKSGQIAVNSAEDLRNGDLAYGFLDTSRWGIQQDYTHETTDAKIPALTQVITAIAFNGNNVELVSNLYESLGKIIADTLAPLMSINGNSEKVNRYLGYKLLKSLQKNSVASNAQELVRDFIKEIESEVESGASTDAALVKGELPTTLSTSNSELFYKVTSDLVSGLNKDTIRQEFDGIAVIQCPSQGVIMLYEDHNGNMYKRSDMLRMARKALLDWESSDPTHIEITIGEKNGSYITKNFKENLISDNELIHWYCNYNPEGKEKFGDVTITSDNCDTLNVGDHVEIGYTVDGKTVWFDYVSRDTAHIETQIDATGQTQFKGIDGEWHYLSDLEDVEPVRKNKVYHIDTPEDLRFIYDKIKSGKIQVRKKFSQQRDLGITKITWTENDGSKNNLFCIESTKELIKDRDNKVVRSWHRANLQGLGSKQPYYYKSIDDFKFEQNDKDFYEELKRTNGNPLRSLNERETKLKDNFVNYVIDHPGQIPKYSQIQIAKTIVSNLNHKAGQQIIPKKYSLFEEQDYSLAEIRDNENFFKDITRNRYTISTKLDEKRKYGIATSFGEIIFENSGIKEGELNTETIESNGKYYITDKIGNKLLEVPSLNYKGIFSTNENGKKILLIKITGPNSDSNFDGFVNSARLLLDKNGLVNAVYEFKSEIGESRVNFKLSKFNKPKEGEKYEDCINRNIEYIANGLRKSWELSHTTISTRIPSQSFQSFLWTETVGYTDTTEFNLGYMNIWEMWFQGSDFDIDKAYTMMYSIAKSGKIAGNIFTDYSSTETIQASLNLPPAKYDLRKGGNHTYNELLDQIKAKAKEIIEYSYTPESDEYKNAINIIDQLNTLNDWARYFEQTVNDDSEPIFNSKLDKYELLKFIIDTVNTATPEEIKSESIGYFESVGPGSNAVIAEADEFIQLLQKYAIEGKQSGKNRIVQGIVSQAESILNLEASQQPMEMAPVTDRIKKSRKNYGIDDDNLEYNEYDIFTRFVIQRANSVGKMDVGIAANGIKAAGALQQYYNTLFAGDMTDERSYGFKDPYIEIDIDSIKKPGIKLVKQRFCKIANTKVPTFEKFKKLYDRAHMVDGNLDYSSDPDYTLFELLKSKAIEFKSQHPDSNPQSISDLINNDIIDRLTPHQKRFAENFIAYVNHVNGIIPENFDICKFEYYSLQFEDNVADYISIFISMSTDNAKELALAKIHGTPELLSMPLAMITLGMDIDTVIDVCVDILDAVHEKMSKNRFMDLSSIDVRDVIAELGKEKVITENTQRSLEIIYDFAQELRSITRFFKVNQGVTTRYSDLKAFSTSLSNDKFKQVERKFGTAQGLFDEDITLFTDENGNPLSKEDIWRQVKTPVNFFDLFESEDPVKIINQYELGRTVVNVMQVVMTSPHFKEQLRATAWILNFIDKNSGKARLADMLLSSSTLGLDEIEDRKIETDSKDSEQAQTESAKSKLGKNQQNTDWFKVKTQEDLERLHSKTLRLIDSWVIGEFIKRNGELRFSVSELEKTYPSNVLTKLGQRTIVRLDTEFGLESFIQFIGQTFIPELQDRFSQDHNFFLESLVMKQHHRNEKLSYWDIRFDPYAVKDNPVIGNNFNACAKDFEKIADLPSGIITTSGINLTIGEVLYLYSVVTSKGLTTGLGTIAHSGGNNSQIFTVTKDSIYEELDKKSQLINSETRYVNQLKHLQEQIKSGSLSDEERNKLAVQIQNLEKVIAQIAQAKQYFEDIKSELDMFIKVLLDDGNSTTVEIEGKQYNLNLTESFIDVFAKPEPASVTINTSGRSIGIEQEIAKLTKNADLTLSVTCEAKEEYRGERQGKDVYIEINITASSKSGINKVSVPLPKITRLAQRVNKSVKSITLTPSQIKEILNIVREAALDVQHNFFSEQITVDQSVQLTEFDESGDSKFIDPEVFDFTESDLRKTFSISQTVENKQVEDNITTLLGNLQTFLKGEHTILHPKEGAIRLRKVNDQTYVIIPEGQKIDTNSLIDLYLESKSDNDYTLNNKLILLLSEIYPNEIINEKNIYEFVKLHKTQLFGNESTKGVLPKVISDYIKDLVERSLQTNLLKSRVREQLLIFSKCINNRKFCYQEITEEDLENYQIITKPGDILVSKSSGAKYLYLGQNEYGEDELILISRGSSLPGSIHEDPWTAFIDQDKTKIYVHTDKMSEEFTLTDKLITNPRIRLEADTASKDKFSLSERTKYSDSVTIRNLKIGDIGEFLGDKWLVLDKVESSIDLYTSDTEFKKRRVWKMIVMNKQGKIITLQCDSVGSEPDDNKIYIRYNNKQYQLDLNDSVTAYYKETINVSNDRKTIINDFKSFTSDEETKLSILSQACGLVVVNGKEYQFKQIVSNDYIQVTTGELIRIDEIDKLEIDAVRDEELQTIVQSKSINVVSKSDEAIASEVSADVDSAEEITSDIDLFSSFKPEHLDGVWVYRKKDNVKEYVPCQYILTEGGKKYAIPRVYLDSYHKVNTDSTTEGQTLRKGDIIYDKGSINGVPFVTVTKVISCEWDNSTKTYKTVLQTVKLFGQEVSNGTNQLKSLSTRINEREASIQVGYFTESDLKSREIYSKTQRVNYTRNMVTTQDEKLKKFINFLENRTGLKVRYVEFPGQTWIARVNNGTIELNRSNLIKDGKVDEKLVLKESMHEFTHVVLGNLRLHNPTVYLEIIHRAEAIVKTLTGKDKQEFDSIQGVEYDSDYSKIEEYIVRKVADMAMGRIYSSTKQNFTQQELVDALMDSMHDQISAFFNTQISRTNSNYSVESLLQRTDIFRAQLHQIDLVGLKSRNLKLDILKQIKKEC